MSTEVTWRTDSTSSDDTWRLGERIGRSLRGGEVIELVSDLGGGKTTLVRGLVAGMGSKDVVHSPSFTLQNDYHGGKLTLHHFDFYRLQEPGIMSVELNEALQDPTAVNVIEWGGIVEDVLPEERLRITITPTQENGRRLDFSCPQNRSYVLDGVKN